MLVYDVNKRKIILDASLLKTDEIKDALLKLGYDSLKLVALFNSFSDHSPLSLTIGKYGYMDKYGTKYWED